MKLLRRALLALGISIIVLAALVAVRQFARRRVMQTRAIVSAHSLASARSEPKPLPVLSASAPPPSPTTPARPPAPPYLDTTAKTLAEQRSALFTNMQNQ